MPSRDSSSQPERMRISMSLLDSRSSVISLENLLMGMLPRLSYTTFCSFYCYSLMAALIFSMADMNVEVDFEISNVNKYYGYFGFQNAFESILKSNWLIIILILISNLT